MMPVIPTIKQNSLRAVKAKKTYMVKEFFGLLVFVLGLSSLQAQAVYKANMVKVHFFSDTPMEDIEATNTKGMSLLDLNKKQIVFSFVIKDFDFENQLMEDHFNEKYLESEKFPKSQFSGQFDRIPDVTQPGIHPVKVTGNLTIHGVTRPVTVNGTLSMKNGIITAKAAFKVKLEDYRIKVPTIVVAKIAEVIAVDLEADYVPKN